MLWTDKYNPKKISDFIGNKEKIEECVEWLRTYKQHKQPLLIQGPIGCGKTILAHFLLESCNYEVIEMNTISSRSKENMLNMFVNSANGMKSLNRMFDSSRNKRPIGYVLDDIDCMDNKHDKGGVQVILEMVNGKNTNRNGKSKW